ncbi:hypothetical protein [Bradyrhizobium yuanmingense]|nr:hypothetical protein [Bradyrhizobium yuanmingense]MDF0495380.1 hypothetical protein [Bradyrhizobium yuanmingense]
MTLAYLVASARRNDPALRRRELMLGKAGLSGCGTLHPVLLKRRRL